MSDIEPEEVKRYWWEDLSGAELRARLTQRGIAENLADRLVETRETEGVKMGISKFLGDE